MSILYSGLSIASILFIWFHTYFLAEYYQLFGLKGWKLMDDYLTKSKDGFYLSFPEWMAQNKPEDKVGKWFFSLVSCPFCLGMILSLPFIIYGFTFLGSSYFITIVGYLLVKKLYLS
jgi:hypothetical protein